MRGFTIVELIVVISIISILSIIMLANYGQGRAIIKQQQSIQTLAQAVRSAQNKALGGEIINCTIPPCKYGIYIVTNSSTISIFGDGVVLNNGEYEPGEEIEFINLEEGVLVTLITAPPAAGGIPDVRIFFEPPDPTISFRPPFGATSIVLTITGGRTVTVGTRGSVDIN